MTCAEFQRVLPYIIESGGNAEEEEHLRTCPVCADLVSDLRYIAEQAKLLVPMEDPDPRVWTGIQKSLQRGGLAKGGPLTRSATGWTVGMRMAMLAALAVVAVALVVRHNSEVAETPQNTLTATSTVDQDDQQLLAAVAGREPELRSAYESNLRDVNAYIADAKQRASRYPEDEAAREHLRHAYAQKAVLFEMVRSQSFAEPAKGD
jgi:hypothetical protein